MKEAISLKKMMKIFMEVASVVDPNKESDNKKEQFLLLATQLKELYNRLTNVGIQFVLQFPKNRNCFACSVRSPLMKI